MEMTTNEIVEEWNRLLKTHSYAEYERFNKKKWKSMEE